MYARRKDPAWLRLIAKGGVFLQNTGRFSEVIQEMTKPSEQYPRLIHFIGRKAKDQAIKRLFSNNNIGRDKLTGVANLRLETFSGSLNSPLLFADSDPFMEPLSSSDPQHAKEAEQHAVAWSQPSTHSVLDAVFARLFFLFSDVVCLFADDFATLEDVASRMRTWAKLGNASNLPRSVRPRVVVIAPDTISSDSCMMELSQRRVEEVFSSVDFFIWGPIGLSGDILYDRLKNVILGHARDMHEVRRENGCLFSATHLESFYRQAIRHTAQTVDRPFDFVTAARLGNEVGEDYIGHIRNFLDLGHGFNIPRSDLASFIASSILMDAYPPKMHCFPPNFVYHTLYKSFCLGAMERSVSDAGSTLLLIEIHMERLFSRLLSGYSSSAHLHRDNLSKQNCSWIQVRSNQTCLYCLRRRPEKTLSCGHAICDTCIRVFGDAVPRVEEKFTMQQCILCGLQITFTAVLQPPTASVSILSVDGGGARGVIPLEFLRLMQEMVDCPVQDLFDMAVGTSSGGLIIIGLFVLHWEVRQSIRSFVTLSKRVFRRWRIPWIIRCLMFGSVFGERAIEESLKEAFGTVRPMFGYDPDGASHKVLVTATKMGDPPCVVFSNYNGPVAIPKNCAYELLRSDVAVDEPPLWKIGRATSAVPGLFPPVLVGSRKFEDGGLGRYNNPVYLALAESRRILPPSTSPDLILSLGTGVEEKPKDQVPVPTRSVIRNSFIYRLSQSMLRSMDGEATWRELLAHIDITSKTDFVRFNASIDQPLEITNVEGMEGLRNAVRIQPGVRQRIRDTTMDALVARFYFVLDSAARSESGMFRCQGSIRCRGDGRTVALNLVRLGTSTMEVVKDTEVLGQLSVTDLDRDICSACGRYRKNILFYVRCRTDIVTIQIRCGAISRRISNFPQSMKWFEDTQGFDACFGSADHGTPGRLNCQACGPGTSNSRARKRKAERESFGDKHRVKRRCVSTQTHE